MRGYFTERHPQQMGHLVPTSDGAQTHAVPTLDLVSQTIAIARFWNRIARYACAVHDAVPERVSIASVSELFHSRESVVKFLGSLGLESDSNRVASYAGFEIRKNTNAGDRLSSSELNALEFDLRAIAYDKVPRPFLSRCGLGELLPRGGQ